MSINFPNSPAIDQIYTTPDGASFVWNGKQWVGFSSTVDLNLSILNPLLVKDFGTVVGTVTAINFTHYLDLTYANNEVEVGVNHLWIESEGGIYRIGNVGIGTTNPSCALELGTPGIGGALFKTNGGVQITGLTTIATTSAEGYLTIGGENATTGVWVGYNQDKSNLVFGQSSGRNVGVNARRNIFIGDQSGRDITNASASDNIILGAYAGLSYQNSNNNVFIGNGVGNDIRSTSLSGSYNVIIGPTGGGGSVWDQNDDSVLLLPPEPQGSHQLVVGSGNTAWIYGNSSFNIGLGTHTPSTRLDVFGGARVTGITTLSELEIGIGHTYAKLSSSGLHLNLDESNNSSLIYLESYFPGGNSRTITLRAPEGAQNYNLVLPSTSGNASELLTTDGNGNLSWTNPIRWYETQTGIHTTYKVSIGTTNATSELTVQGNAEISGTVFAGAFSGPGIVTSIIAGSNISIDQSSGAVTISATAGGMGGSSQWVTNVSGIHTLSNVGIGTTIAGDALTVSGVTSTTNLRVSGVSTFSGNSIFGTTTHTNATISSTLEVDGQAWLDGGALFGPRSLGTAPVGIDTNGNVNITGITTTNRLSVGVGGTILTTTSSGRVGIKTSNPTADLEVRGTISVSGISTFSDSVRVATNSNADFHVGFITSGVGTDYGLLVDSVSGQLISNNSGTNGGYYLRTNGTNTWYVDQAGRQFNTGRIELGPNISTPNTRLETSGNANFAGILTASQFVGNGSSLVGVGSTVQVRYVSYDANLNTAVASIFSKGDYGPINWVFVQVVGAGGGGSSAASAGGGGSGAVNQRLFRAQDLPANCTVVAGAGGTGGYNSAGGNGSESYFEIAIDNYVRANGGRGGSSNVGGAGGENFVITTAALNNGAGGYFSAAGGNGATGSGGNSLFGPSGGGGGGSTSAGVGGTTRSLGSFNIATGIGVTSLYGGMGRGGNGGIGSARGSNGGFPGGGGGGTGVGGTAGFGAGSCVRIWMW